jgi:hypothetical protein
MGRKRRDRCKPLPHVKREEQYVPKPGPGQVFIQEGDDIHRHFVNVGDPLDFALSRDQITSEMFSAGNTFRVLFAKLHRSGTDSTQALNLKGGAGTGFTDVQAEAGASLANIRDRMSARDYRIVQLFCGEAHAMAEAVQRVTPCHPSNIKYRMAEALEGLEDALDALRIKRAA